MNIRRTNPFERPIRLGQVPLVLGPSSWQGPGVTPLYAPPAVHTPVSVPPYYGEWGAMGESGRVGPYDTVEEAFNAAVAAAVDAGATALPTDGFAQVVDSRGRAVGPVT
jgi:hypothetical protein